MELPTDSVSCMSTAHLSNASDGSYIAVCVSFEEVPLAIRSLRDRGFAIYELRAAEHPEADSLADMIANCFGVRQGVSLDAVCDEVWQRLMEHPEERACVVWRDGGIVMSRNPQLFVDCVEVLIGLAASMARESTTNWSHRVLLRVLIEGTGNRFQGWA